MSLRLALLSLSIMVLACDKGDLAVSPDPVGSISLLPGTEATYAWTSAEVDSTGSETIVASDSLLTRVVATGEVLVPDSDLIQLQAYSLTHHTGEADVWYRQTSQQLVEVAYSGVGAIPVIILKAGHSKAYAAPQQSPMGTIFGLPVIVRRLLAARTPAADSIVKREEPRIIIEYPLVVGENWVSFSSPFLETREVVGIESIQVAGGSFSCVKIRTRLPDTAPDLEWYDYISHEGLILRTLSLRLARATGQDPSSVDTVQVRERTELLGFYSGQ
jgi:hypothetical protein